jgi:hypothetical protein
VVALGGRSTGVWNTNVGNAVCAARTGPTGMILIGRGAAAELTMPEQNGQSAPGPECAAEVVSVIVRPERPHPSTQQIGSVAEMRTMSNPRTHARALRKPEV